MSKSVEEVRRDLFQSWVGKFNSMPAALYVDERGRYIDDWIQCRWLGFNAALDAVEIHMPSLVGLDQPFTGTPISEIRAHNHYNQALADCRAAIEQTGLGLRVL